MPDYCRIYGTIFYSGFLLPIDQPKISTQNYNICANSLLLLFNHRLESAPKPVLKLECAPPKSRCWNLMANGMVLRAGDFEVTEPGGLFPWQWDQMSCTRAPWKEFIPYSSVPFALWGHATPLHRMKHSDVTLEAEFITHQRTNLPMPGPWISQLSYCEK
jgi:hypothetical protein